MRTKAIKLLIYLLQKHKKNNIILLKPFITFVIQHLLKMRSTHRYILTLGLLTTICISCSDGGNEKSAPIVLGDSATIVTETDGQYLGDFVADIQLQKPEVHDTDTIMQPLHQEVVDKPFQDTIATVAKEAPETKPSGGLNIPFKEVTIHIAGITTKTYRAQNLEKVHGATYELVNGKINGSKLTVSNATITKVSQRYIANVLATNEDNDKLVLTDLSETTDWAPIKGRGNTYTINDLDANHLEVSASPAKIRNAISRAAKNKRLSRKAIQQWEQLARKAHSVKQEPLSLKLRSVMWKVEGKDKTGKSFQKQIRIDIPV